VNRAGSALAVITAFFRARERDDLADAIQERRSRINLEAVVLAIDPQRDRNGTLNTARICVHRLIAGAHCCAS
jgi:hypothetical protein